MASLCQRCTGEDDARSQIDITKSGNPRRDAPRPAPARPGAMGTHATSNPQPQVGGAQDVPASPTTPKTPKTPDASRAPNAQVIGDSRAEPGGAGNLAPMPPPPPADSEDGTTEYCLCFPYRHRMEEDEAMQRACWCAYCCCMGIALHRRPSPLQLKSHCTCCEQTWETQDVDGVSGGPWSCINTCCFCTFLCLLPRRLGHPRCICCQEDCCGVVGGYKGAAERSSGEDRGLSAYDHALYEQFVPCYCCCCGIGVVPVFVSLINSFSKCFCCMCRVSTGPPDFEGGELCFNMLNCWCCLGHCRIVPELRKNPICACCGWRWKKWKTRPGTDRAEYVDSANEIHCDFPLSAIDYADDTIVPAGPGMQPHRENPKNRWQDHW